MLGGVPLPAWGVPGLWPGSPSRRGTPHQYPLPSKEERPRKAFNHQLLKPFPYKDNKGGGKYMRRVPGHLRINLSNVYTLDKKKWQDSALSLALRPLEYISKPPESVNHRQYYLLPIRRGACLIPSSFLALFTLKTKKFWCYCWD
jgi:hypothetical protein